MAGNTPFDPTTYSDTAPISALPNLGTKSQQMLAKAGIENFGQLKRLGSVAAYVQTKQANNTASLNLLWALESALTGMPWQQVSRKLRGSLLLALDAYTAEIERTLKEKQ